MTKLLKVILVMGFFILSFYVLGFPQAGENITVTTYYPSPFGVYRVLRLQPGIRPAGACTEGDMYYDNGVAFPRGLYICGATGWQRTQENLWTLTGTNLYPNDNAWKVGIGTTNPAAKLQISNNMFIDGALHARPFYIQMDSAGSYAALLTAAMANAAGYGLGLGAMDGETFGSISGYKFTNGMGADSANLILQRGAGINNNVGIGTTTPNYKLEVQKTGSAPAILVGGGNPGSPRIQIYDLDVTKSWMGLGTGMGGGGSAEYNIYFPTDGPGKLTIGDYNGTTYNPRMTFTPDGNVGIGTTDPEAKFQISNNITIDPVRYARPVFVQMNSAGTEPKLHTAVFANANGYGIGLGAYDRTGDTFGSISAYKFTDGYGDNDVNLILQREGGNVGIGTTAPDPYKLKVDNGMFRAEKNVYDSGWFHILKDSLYVKDHNLGTTAVHVEILLSDNPSGNNAWAAEFSNKIDIDFPALPYFVSFKNLTSTQITIFTALVGWQKPCVWAGQPTFCHGAGVGWDGYCRVLIWALGVD